MKFKSPKVEAEYENTSVFLRDMAVNLDTWSQIDYGQEIIITRVKEQICGDSGVHEDNRAFDVRDEFEGGRIYNDDQIKVLLARLNSFYPRNDGKPTAIHHSFQGGPLHIHVQLASLTKTYEPIPTPIKNNT